MLEINDVLSRCNFDSKVDDHLSALSVSLVLFFSPSRFVLFLPAYVFPFSVRMEDSLCVLYYVVYLFYNVMKSMILLEFSFSATKVYLFDHGNVRDEVVIKLIQLFPRQVVYLLLTNGSNRYCQSHCMSACVYLQYSVILMRR